MDILSEMECICSQYGVVTVLCPLTIFHGLPGDCSLSWTVGACVLVQFNLSLSVDGSYDLLVTHELQRRCWISFLRWKHLPYCFCSLYCFPVCVLKWSVMLEWFMSPETVGSLTERPQIKQKVSHGSSKPTSGSFPSKTFSWDLSSGHQLDFSPWEDLGTEKVLCRAWSLNPQMLWDNKYKLFFNTLLNLWFFITLNSLFNFFLSCT